MISELLTKWLVHYDPIHLGWSNTGIANGVCATNGFFFPRIRGGYNLVRAVERVPGSDAEIVGAAAANCDTIKTFPWVEHDADTTYVYRILPIGGGGICNSRDETCASARFGSDARWQGNSPNAPSDLQVRPAANGRIDVRWVYSREGEQAEPAAFHVYTDHGLGSIDYSEPQAVVAYRRGGFHYQYVSDPHEHGTRVCWAVRAVSVAGVEDSNTVIAVGWSIAQPPAKNPTSWTTCETV